MLIFLLLDQLWSSIGSLHENISWNPICSMKSMVFGLCALSTTTSIITDDTHFYGQSPPVYPSRMSSRFQVSGFLLISSLFSQYNRYGSMGRALHQGEGACCPFIPWRKGKTKQNEFLAFLPEITNFEQSNLTFGVLTTENGCGGFIPGIPRVGFPGLCLADAGNGVRPTDLVNGYPAGLSVAARWVSPRILKPTLSRSSWLTTHQLEPPTHNWPGPLHGRGIQSQRR